MGAAGLTTAGEGLAVGLGVPDSKGSNSSSAVWASKERLGAGPVFEPREEILGLNAEDPDAEGPVAAPIELSVVGSGAGDVGTCKEANWREAGAFAGPPKRIPRKRRSPIFPGNALRWSKIFKA